MKIAAFDTERGPHLGVVEGDTIVDLQAVDPKLSADLAGWLQEYGSDLEPLARMAQSAPASARRPLDDLKFALPISRPGKIVCLGLNYLEHAREGGHPRPDFPAVFLRSLTSLVPHEA